MKKIGQNLSTQTLPLLVASLGFPWWFAFLEGSFKRVAQGYNCGNLPAENQREKGKKSPLFRQLPCLDRTSEFQEGNFNIAADSVLDSDLDSAICSVYQLLFFPRQIFLVLLNESTRPRAHGQIWHHRRAIDALNRRAVVLMWNADLAGGRHGAEAWRETRRGGATHGLLFSPR